MARKNPAHGVRAAQHVQRGREAEMRGDFSTAAVWYKKAGVAYRKAGSKLRAKLWSARGRDVNSPDRKMGTLYRGDRKKRIRRARTRSAILRKRGR